jgi:hypothetical protein
MSNDARQKDYKHRGLGPEELRKRREDLTISLRKQKRDEQVRQDSFSWISIKETFE